MDWLSMGGSALATLMVLRSLPGLVPPEIYGPVRSLVLRLLRRASPTATITVDEFDGNGYLNHVYELVRAYLGARSASVADNLTLCQARNSRHAVYAMADNERFVETFDGGLKLTWSSLWSSAEQNDGGGVKRSYQLVFHAAHKQKVQEIYIPRLLEEAEDIKFKHRERKLYTNRPLGFGGGENPHWRSLPFTHPSTFNTLALDPTLKEEVKDDLSRFVRSKEYYARTGRAWKRGYLLYGPPGTGKTSLIAAIANFLDYDIFDLELSAVPSNSELRNLLISTSSRSVVVVEDIDCSVDLSRRGVKRTREGEEAVQPPPADAEEAGAGRSPCPSRISLSGVLNFVDGLWSSCGEERLIIFTTNHKEDIDPALLRPGRMDKHIYMGYCEFEAFKVLARNYAGIDGGHELMKEVKDALPSARMTPADVAEVLMGFKDDPNLGMRGMVEQMKKRRRCQAESSPEEQGVKSEAEEKVCSDQGEEDREIEED